MNIGFVVGTFCFQIYRSVIQAGSIPGSRAPRHFTRIFSQDELRTLLLNVQIAKTGQFSLMIYLLNNIILYHIISYYIIWYHMISYIYDTVDTVYIYIYCLYLFISIHIYLYLFISIYIYSYLFISIYIYLCLFMSIYVYLCLLHVWMMIFQSRLLNYQKVDGEFRIRMESYCNG